MRAARYHGRRDVRIEDVPLRDPLRDEATVRVHAVGLCGSDVHEYFSVGAVVAVEPIESCGRCARCRHGRRSLCRQVAFHGLHRDGGGLSDFTVVPRSMTHRVPPGVSLDHA